MDLVNRRQSGVKIHPKHSALLIAGVALFLFGVATDTAKAQGKGFNAPQKQVFTLTFGLGSTELNPQYGRNKASMAEFNDLLQQVSETPSARIDSIVITSYSTVAEPLGSVEIAQNRISAVKAQIAPVIRSSALNYPVVVTGQVIAKNDIFMPNQVFDLLKKATIELYMNGMTTAKVDNRALQAMSAAEEEARYIDPFGHKRASATRTQVATTRTPASESAFNASTSSIPERTTSMLYTERGALTNQNASKPNTEVLVPQQSDAKTMVSAETGNRYTFTEPDNKNTAVAESEPVRKVEAPTPMVVKPQVTVIITCASCGASGVHTHNHQVYSNSDDVQAVIVGSNGALRTQADTLLLDADLQRFIDSLTGASTGGAVIAAPVVTAPVKPIAETVLVPVQPVAPQPVQPVQPVVPQPVPSVQQESCGQVNDPEIDALIKRLMEEQGANPELPQSTPATATTEISSVTVVPAVVPAAEPKVEKNKKTQQPKAEKQPVAQSKREVKFKEEQPKPEKTPRIKPVKQPREPLVLSRPFVAAKTNLAYWAAIAANLEAEFYFADRWSAALEGVYTNWDMNLYKKHYAVNEISPEVRYWLGKKTGQYRGLYVGVYGHMGQFDYMFQNQTTGNTGDYYGGGVSFGAYLPFTNHFGMELGLRGGYVHADYDRYYKAGERYIWRESRKTDYLGLTGVKVSLVYRFGLGGKR